MKTFHEQPKTDSSFSVNKRRKLLLAVGMILLISTPFWLFQFKKTSPPYLLKKTVWQPADIATIKDKDIKATVLYGQSLITHTAQYLGPKGTVLRISNGMNCQNCHLAGGTTAYGNNFGSVAATYPKFRARSGGIETIIKRVNDCFERSLNGIPLDSTSREMKAIVAYIQFIGSNVTKGQKAKGSGLKELPFLDRAADSTRGKQVYATKCMSCHQQKGQGVFTTDGKEYLYPALWGKQSFNDAAGLYRISNFAKFVKYNMPQGATYLKPQLTDEEAWDVAAYILSQPRQHKVVLSDWPDITQKPIDLSFGPFADSFSSTQHKYGPFKPIQAVRD